jgi:hypothetical protein
MLMTRDSSPMLSTYSASGTGVAAQSGSTSVQSLRQVA